MENKTHNNGKSLKNNNNNMKMTTKTKSPRKKSRGIGTFLLYLNKNLIKFFHALGRNVATYPVFYIVVPVIITAVLGTGLAFMKMEDDPFTLFIPYTVPSVYEKKVIEQHFPVDSDTRFSALRVTRHEGHSRILISAKDNGTILRSELWPEIMSLEEAVQNVSISEHEDGSGRVMNYADLCAKWQGKCQRNLALNLNSIIPEIENGSMYINYPVMVVPFILPQLLGGIEVDEEEGIITDVKAIMLIYFVNIDTPEDVTRTHRWEIALLDMLLNRDSDYIRTSPYTSHTLQDEIAATMHSSLPLAPVTGIIMVVVCVGLLWMRDSVRSKPLIGLVAIISSILACIAAFGLLSYCGAINSSLNSVALFMVLGIGVDDVFVAISAWQQTSRMASVPDRLAETYSDAAVSVTITSVTNCLAFAVGTTMPVLVVRSMCLYCGVTIIFAYLYFITFCGAWLSLSGKMEEQGRHSLFFYKLKSEEYEKKFEPHVVSVFFRDQVAPLLCNKHFRVFAFFSVLVYLGGAIYGMTGLREGLSRIKLTNDYSYFTKFVYYEDRYFRKFPYTIQVVLTGNITYSDPETQKEITELTKTFEGLQYGSSPVFTRFWLKNVLSRLRRKKEWRDKITDEKSFIKFLREDYFTKPGDYNILDLEFNEDYSRITASRMLFQAENVIDDNEDVKMMNEYRRVAEESKFNVTTYHILFAIFDINALTRPLASQSIIMVAIVVIIVSLPFIPHLWGCVALSCSIISIAIGVLGYMSYWDITLDQISAGSIFICIGFSVDFSAHINYTFLSSKEKNPDDKIKSALFTLGFPILQGAITTILSLVPLGCLGAYGYRTFFKTIFLVTIFSVYHSIVLIPLFLTFLETFSKKINGDSDDCDDGDDGGADGEVVVEEGGAKRRNTSVTNLALSSRVQTIAERRGVTATSLNVRSNGVDNLGMVDE